MKISVIINTFNSAATLQQCLESVKLFDEIIICDMYSDDNTLDIAKQYGAKIFMHERFNGIVEPARDFAVKQASCDWVFVVDSDEVVTADLREYFYKVINSTDTPSGLLVPRKNYFMNKFMRSDFPDYQLRFFKKDKYILWPSTIHDRPKIDGKIEKVPAKQKYAFIHLDKNRISNMMAKLNRYSDRELEKEKNQNGNMLKLIIKPFHCFFQMYILKGGICDGKAGFIYAKYKAFNKFLIVSRSIEQKTIAK